MDNAVAGQRMSPQTEGQMPFRTRMWSSFLVQLGALFLPYLPAVGSFCSASIPAEDLRLPLQFTRRTPNSVTHLLSTVPVGRLNASGEWRCAYALDGLALARPSQLCMPGECLIGLFPFIRQRGQYVEIVLARAAEFGRYPGFVPLREVPPIFCATSYGICGATIPLFPYTYSSPNYNDHILTTQMPRQPQQTNDYFPMAFGHSRKYFADLQGNPICYIWALPSIDFLTPKQDGDFGCRFKDGFLERFFAYRTTTESPEEEEEESRTTTEAKEKMSTEMATESTQNTTEETTTAVTLSEGTSTSVKLWTKREMETKTTERTTTRATGKITTKVAERRTKRDGMGLAGTASTEGATTPAIERGNNSPGEEVEEQSATSPFTEQTPTKAAEETVFSVNRTVYVVKEMKGDNVAEGGHHSVDDTDATLSTPPPIVKYFLHHWQWWIAVGAGSALLFCCCTFSMVLCFVPFLHSQRPRVVELVRAEESGRDRGIGGMMRTY